MSDPSSYSFFTELIWLLLSGSYLVLGLYHALVDDGTFCGSDFSSTRSTFRFRKHAISRWFVGLIMNGLLLFLVLQAYVFAVPPYAWLTWLLDRVGVSHGGYQSSHLSIILAMLMMFTHIVQKFHQSAFIHVHGDVTQGILDAVSPYVYNVTVGLTILACAPRLDDDPGHWLSVWSVSWRHLIGIPVFCWATLQDHSYQDALVRTRKNRAGHIVSNDHKPPNGPAYETVSCPSFSMEIISHVAIWLVLGFCHHPFLLLCSYVVASHVTRALARRRWFRREFEDYPSERPAIIPGMRFF